MSELIKLYGGQPPMGQWAEIVKVDFNGFEEGKYLADIHTSSATAKKDETGDEAENTGDGIFRLVSHHGKEARSWNNLTQAVETMKKALPGFTHYTITPYFS